MKSAFSAMRILSAVVVALLVGALMAGGPAFWQRYLAARAAGSPWLAAGHIAPVVRVAGGAGTAPPRADAAAQNIAPEAIEAMLGLARQQQARIVILHRRGHRVAEYYGAGDSAMTELSGGALSPLPWVLALEARAFESEQGGSAPGVEPLLAGLASTSMSETGSWRNPWSRAAKEHFGAVASEADARLPGTLRSAQLLSSQLWRRIGASDAAVQVDAGGLARVSCCFVAAAGDWMRLADLIIQQGEYAGERLVAAQAVQQLPWLHASAATTGDEPPATRDALALDLQHGARLWLAPQRGIALLYVAQPGSSLASDTALVNLVFRGIIDQQAPGADTTHSGGMPGR